MPSDLVVNVRQISSYPIVAPAPPDALLLVQNGGLGSPYATVSASALVATALASGTLPLGVGISPPANAAGGQTFSEDVVFQAGGAVLNNFYFDAQGVQRYLSSGPASAFEWDPSLGFAMTLAPAGSAGQPVPGLTTMLSLSLAGNLTLPFGTLTVARDPSGDGDVTTLAWVGRNTVASFNGRRGAIQLWSQDIYTALGYTSAIATQQWVTEQITAAFQSWLMTCPVVTRWNGRYGSVYLTLSDISTVFFQPGQQPITPTPPATSNDYSIANTAWVTEYVTETLAGGQGLATQAWVMANTVAAFNGRIGQVSLTTADITGAGGAPIQSPQLQGIPTAPTAQVGNATSQIATTAFVWSAVQESTTGVVSFNGRTGVITLDATDINNAGGALLNSPALQGVPTAPTATTGTTTTQLATCAFVLNEVQAIGAGVTSFNTRSGNVTLVLTDIESAGGAPIASPAFSGTPTCPTPASPVAATTTIANTNWVVQYNALNTVASFNGRIGAVTLNANDLTALGALVNPSVVLTGNPVAPTAAPTTNTTQIATCAFVQQALANLAGVTVSPTPPASPYMGQAWFNSTAGVNQLYVYTGAAFSPSSNLAGYAQLAGATFTGPIVLSGNATANLNPVSLQQANANYLALTGGNVTGSVGIGVPVPAGMFAGGLAVNTIAAIGPYGFALNTYLNTAGSGWIYGNTNVPMTINASTTQVSFNVAPAGTAGGTATGFVVPLTLFPNGTVYAAQNASGAFFGVGPSPTNFFLQDNGTNRVLNFAPSFALAYNISTSIITIQSSGGNVQFGPTGVASASSTFQAQRMMCTASSNFGFYSTGTPGLYLFAFSTNSFLQWNNQSADFSYQGPNALMTIQRVSDSAFIIPNQAYKPGGGVWADSSDARVKTVIGAYQQGLAEIQQLHPVRYNYLGNYADTADGAAHHANSTDREFIGLVAQDVETVFPEMITTRSGFIDGEAVDDIRMMDTSPLVFALINAVAELASRVQTLEARA